MLVKSRGIVFNHIRYSESSIITTIYTEKHGRLAFIVNNARNIKSKLKGNIFQPLVIIDFDYYYNSKKELNRIKEVQVTHPFKSIPFNIHKCTMAIFITEILDKAIKEVEPNKEMFEFIYDSVICFDTDDKNYSDFHITFLLRLTKYLGFFPVINYSKEYQYFNLDDGMFIHDPFLYPNCLGINTSRHFFQFLSDNTSDLRMTREIRKSILESIIKYYYLHLEGIKEIKSLRVLNEVFENNNVEQN